PSFTLSPEAMTTTDLNTVRWSRVRLPRHAIVADLAFHANVGLDPKNEFLPYRITLTEDPIKPILRQPLSMEDPLEIGDRIVFEKISEKETRPSIERPFISLPDQDKLFKKVTTAAALIRLLPGHL